MCAQPQYDVVVVGAGISGLTSAFLLQAAGVDVAVVESETRPGGSIQTHREGDWLFELGPNTVLEKNADVTALIAASGLAGDKLTANKAANKRFVLKGGRPTALPSGPLSFVRSPLFSTRAKLRLLREPWIRKGNQADESIASFVRRRLGEELLDYAVGPFVSGVYAGDPDRLAVRWSVPKIAALEAQYGSLIRGALALRKGPAPKGAMFSFRKGLAQLVDHLSERCGTIQLTTPCQRILSDSSGYVVETANGALKAKQVILTVPADVVARLLGAIAPEADRFDELPYAPVATLALGFARDAVKHPLDGFGVLVPRRESLRLLGCLFCSQIFSGRAPDGHVALTAFVGGRTDPKIVDCDPQELLSAVVGELQPMLQTTAQPVYTKVTSWRRGIPQYESGHGHYLRLAEQIERGHPGLHLACNWRHGVSVPDCIAAASELARRIVQQGPIGRG